MTVLPSSIVNDVIPLENAIQGCHQVTKIKTQGNSLMNQTVESACIF